MSFLRAAVNSHPSAHIDVVVIHCRFRAAHAWRCRDPTLFVRPPTSVASERARRPLVWCKVCARGGYVPMHKPIPPSAEFSQT